jgi:hypothetical protein
MEMAGRYQKQMGTNRLSLDFLVLEKLFKKTEKQPDYQKASNFFKSD